MIRTIPIFLILLPTLLAGNAIIPKAHFVISKNKKFMLSMSRPIMGEKGEFTSKGKCAAYKILEDGTLEKIWNTEGWYSHELLLSRDGKYMVRRGSRKIWFKFSDPKLAVAFYKNGKLLKEYTVMDLAGAQPNHAEADGWEERSAEFPILDHLTYKIKINNGKVISFDVQTGLIIRAH